MIPQHIDEAVDNYNVDLFAQRMKEKLEEARNQGKGGWWEEGACTAEQLSQALLEHVAKGDPVDVANIAMFLWARGERIAGVIHD